MDMEDASETPIIQCISLLLYRAEVRHHGRNVNFGMVAAAVLDLAGLEFSRLESWSRDVSRPSFQSLGLGLGLEA